MSQITIEKIICPKCKEIIAGEIIHDWPFDSYYGYCEKCDYPITESEWEKTEVAE